MKEASSSGGVMGWRALVWLAPGLGVWFLVVWGAAWYWRHQTELQFGWTVLVLCLLMLREQALVPREVVGRWSVWSLAGLVAGLGVLLIFRLVQLSLGTTPLSLFVGLAGALLVLGANADLVFGRRAIVPYVFAAGYLFLALPLPSVVYSPVVATLQRGVTVASSEVLALFGVPVVLQGNILELAGARLGVNDACSGVRSLQSTLMIGLLLGHMMLERVPSRVVVLVAGVGVAFVMNVVRLVVVGLWGAAHRGESIERVHDIMGWVEWGCIFVGLLGLIWFVGRVERRWVRLLARPPSPVAVGG